MAQIEALKVVPAPPLGKARVLFDSEALYVALDRERRERRMSWRAVLRAAGIPGLGLITRLGRGHAPDISNVARLLLWLGDTDLKPYLRPITASTPPQTDDGEAGNA